DPAAQLRRAAELVADPPLPDAGLDNLLSAFVKLEARTRILRFDLPAPAG
ncbi:MAG: hypothetical protein QOI98_887, partial [Solirubrobacteraceae bacterium]|nr:hypothetical protein [Solirubrobacteraceae bacterium]